MFGVFDCTDATRKCAEAFRIGLAAASNGTASIDGSLGTLDQKEEKWWDVYLENSNHTLISGEHIINIRLRSE